MPLLIACKMGVDMDDCNP